MESVNTGSRTRDTASASGSARPAKEETETEEEDQDLPSIETNFQAQGLSAPEFLVLDAATLSAVAHLEPALRPRSPPSLLASTAYDEPGEAVERVLQASGEAWDLAANGLFDAIVTDPPYGKREWLGGRREEDSLGRKEGTRSSWNGASDGTSPINSGTSSMHGQDSDPASGPASHGPVPGTNPLGSLETLEERINVLLTLAARKLVPGGRLVYWLPVHSSYVYAASAETSQDCGESDRAEDEDSSRMSRHDQGQNQDQDQGVEQHVEQSLEGAPLGQGFSSLLPRHPDLQIVTVGLLSFLSPTTSLHRSLFVPRVDAAVPI